MIEQLETYPIDQGGLQVAEPVGNHGLLRSGTSGNQLSQGTDPQVTSLGIRNTVQQNMLRLRSLVVEVGQALGFDSLLPDRAVQDAHPFQDNVAVPLLDLLQLTESCPAVTAVLGLGGNGEAVLQNFADESSPHLLVTGGRDSGKTILLRTAAASLAINSRQRDLQLAAISPSNGDLDHDNRQLANWLPLNYLPHMLCDVATEPEQIIELLSFLDREVSYRERKMFSTPSIVLMIDGVDILLRHSDREVSGIIRRLIQKGQDAGIHLAMSAQALPPDVFTTQLLMDVPIRLAGRTSISDQQVVQDTKQQDLHLLLGEGDFYLFRDRNSMHMQAALINDHDLHLVLTEMYRRSAILLARPLSARVRLQEPQSRPKVQKTDHPEPMIAFPV